MADKISALPAASPLTGAELVPVVQGGTTVKCLTSAIAGCPGPGGGSCQNVFHLELVNRGTDFPLQTIFQPTRAGNYQMMLSGIDSVNTWNINAKLFATYLGGSSPTCVELYNLPGPGSGGPPMPQMALLFTVDGIAPVQMSVINSDPTYAGGTEFYTVYVDLVRQG